MYIKEKLKQLNFTTTTKIQDLVFKHFEEKKHLVGLSKTGTGKTHSYLLPLLKSVDLNLDYVQGIIVVPTNELVQQVKTMLDEVDDRFIVKAYYGIEDKKRETSWLENKQPHIVITTPQRLQFYALETRKLQIHKAKYVIFDEADMMFDEAFLSMIDQFINLLKQSKYLLFSATITKAMEPFIATYFGQFTLIDARNDDDLNIEHLLIATQNKLNTLTQVIESINPFLCMIFVSKIEAIDVIYELLAEKHKDVAKLSSKMNLRQRRMVIEGIRQHKYQYVVTSDLGARGLDFKVSHVIQFDLPYHLEYFHHRSGRTGRMFDSGVCITLYEDKENRKIEKLRQSGVIFKNTRVTKDGLKPQVKKITPISQAEMNAVKSIKKPSKIKPNYKKKNKEAITKAKKQARRKAIHG